MTKATISTKHHFYLHQFFRLLLMLAPITYYYFGKIHSLSIFVALFTPIIIMDYLTIKNPKIATIFEKIFGSALNGHEFRGKKFHEISWIAITIILNFLIFKEEIAITSFSIMVITMVSAAIARELFVTRMFFERVASGSIAFFIAGIIVLFLCATFFISSIWFYIFGFFSLICITIIEARPKLFNIDDSLIITLGFSSFMTIFNIIWSFI